MDSESQTYAKQNPQYPHWHVDAEQTIDICITNENIILTSTL